MKTAIGQLNKYLLANYEVELPAQSSANLPTNGNWIVTAAGTVPSGLRGMVELTEGIGDQGFVVRQIAAPSGNGRWLLVWGKTPLGCRYGLMELLRTLQSKGKNCFCDLAQVREEPAFPCRIYFHNFGEHMLDIFNVNLLYDVPFGRWTRAEWRSYLEMIAAMRYTTYEFWFPPTFFSSKALKTGHGSKYNDFADTMRWVIDQAHELGIKVEILMDVNCTEAKWISLCPHIPEEHRTILALWSHWTKQLSNADGFSIMPGDVGGCHKNGCTHETFIDLCLEIIATTRTNGSFTFEIASWGPPFFDWGVPAGAATLERRKVAWAYFFKRLPDFPKGTVYSVNRNGDINSIFSGAPKDPRWSNREVVDELRKSAPVISWDYYLTELEQATMPHYHVPAVLQACQEEQQWGYSGGINNTMAPRLNVLTAFATAESFWNPNQTEGDVLRKFSDYVFGSPETAPKVFPYVAAVGQPDWKTFHTRMKDATQILKSVEVPVLCKLFVAPDADQHRQNLLYYTSTYERLSSVVLEVEEIISLSHKAKLSEVKAWRTTAPESADKKRVQNILAGWGDFDLSAARRNYRSLIYGVYDLATGPDVRSEWAKLHCQQFIDQFGVTSFFDTKVGGVE